MLSEEAVVASTITVKTSIENDNLRRNFQTYFRNGNSNLKAFKEMEFMKPANKSPVPFIRSQKRSGG